MKKSDKMNFNGVSKTFNILASIVTSVCVIYCEELEANIRCLKKISAKPKVYTETTTAIAFIKKK